MENFFENYEPLYPRHSIYKLHPYIFRGSYIEVPTVNKEKEVTGYSFVDINDSDEVLQYSYSRRESNRTWYAISNTGVGMHNIIMYDELNGLEVDHWDRCGFNNRRKNLIPATRLQQAQNQNKKIGASCKYKGVHKISHGGYVATMKINQEKFHLGYFQNPEDAAKIYDANVLKEHGIYCFHNKLLTQEEIDYIVTNKEVPEKYQVKQVPRKYPHLPDNITKTHNGKYRFKKWRNGTPKFFYCDTLEDAIAKKTEIINIWTEEDILKEQERCANPIMRNGKYVIPVRRYNKIYAFYVDYDIWLKISHISWTMDDLGYTIGQYERKLWSMHRLIWFLSGREITDEDTIDHINPYKKYDHRIIKLRLADMRLQSHNRTIYDKIDPYLGVQARLHGFVVNIDGIHYGTFETQEEAALRANFIYKEHYPNVEVPNKVDISKRTTLDSRLDGRMNRKYISSITSLSHLQHVLVKLGLTEVLGIKLHDLRSSDRKRIQQYILDKYYPLNIYKEEEDHSMDDHVDKSEFPGWPMILQDELDEHYALVIPELEIDQINRIANIDVLKRAIMGQRLNKNSLRDGKGIDIASITAKTMPEYKKLLIKLLYPNLKEITPEIHESEITDPTIKDELKRIDNFKLDALETYLKDKKLNKRNGGTITVRNLTKISSPFYKYLVKKALFPHIIFTEVIDPDKDKPHKNIKVKKDPTKLPSPEEIDNLSVRALGILINSQGLSGKNNNKNYMFEVAKIDGISRPDVAQKLINHLYPNSDYKVKRYIPPPKPTAEEIEAIGNGTLKEFAKFITLHNIGRAALGDDGIKLTDITEAKRQFYIDDVKRRLL